MEFDKFFRAATGFEPYPYQRRLANRAVDFVRIETGLGKTEGLVLGWLWRRLTRDDEPRRLIYSLPMRSLVEQTLFRIEAMLQGLREEGYDPHDLPKLGPALGGFIADTWYQEPERSWIVVGTQDMLLSRALNRGYAMSRFQWSMAFGALNNDTYWVIDEVQLQGIGAVTATQLQSFRDRYGTFGKTATTLASATLDTSWFESADFTLSNRTEERLNADDLRIERANAIVNARKTMFRLEDSSEAAVAAAVHDNHREGTLTLVVVNRVERAKDIFRRLRSMTMRAELVLLHSRFRPPDRAFHARQVIASVDEAGPGRIVIATQVVEAGIDISAVTLFSDTAPWSSFVQRLGRCNRRGRDQDARVFWIDIGDASKKTAPPYSIAEIQNARAFLTPLVGKDLAPARLASAPIDRGAGLTLRSPELFDLFDTSVDLLGHDVDVSPYIRESEDFTVSVFWRAQPPTPEQLPQRDELCAVPLQDIRKLIDHLRSANASSKARIPDQFADSRETDWITLRMEAVRPGLTVWLDPSVGHYDSEVGFDSAIRAVVGAISISDDSRFYPECYAIEGDAESQLPVAQTISEHSRETRDQALLLLAALSLREDDVHNVLQAALWHDVGKAHAVFQHAMHRGMPEMSQTELWAKADRRIPRYERRGFRHELPGALAYRDQHNDSRATDVIAFLIAAHHGKFRVSAQPLPSERDSSQSHVLGVNEGDMLQRVQLDANEISHPCTLSLGAFRVGSSVGDRTWVDRVVALRDDHSYGPFRLAYLELLVRVADWRASRNAAERKGRMISGQINA